MDTHNESKCGLSNNQDGLVTGHVTKLQSYRAVHSCDWVLWSAAQVGQDMLHHTAAQDRTGHIYESPVWCMVRVSSYSSFFWTSCHAAMSLIVFLFLLTCQMTQTGSALCCFVFGSLFRSLDVWLVLSFLVSLWEKSWMVDATWLMVAMNVPSASLVKVFCLKMASLDSLGKGAQDNGYPREVKPFRKLSSMKFLMCLRNVCHQRHAQHLSSVVVAVIAPSLAPS